MILHANSAFLSRVFYAPVEHCQPHPGHADLHLRMQTVLQGLAAVSIASTDPRMALLLEWHRQ